MEDEAEGKRLVARADELSSHGRYEEAITCYEQAIARAPSALSGYRFVIGELYFDLQRYPEAERAFEEVVRALPAYAQGWEALGRTLAMIGAHDRAIVALERAIALAPTWGAALYHAALAYGELGQRAAMEDRMRRAIAVDPRYARAAEDDGLT
jgi:tetratricopeptide (TPR) repeat protein